MSLDIITGTSYWNVSFDEWIQMNIPQIGGLLLKKRFTAALALQRLYLLIPHMAGGGEVGRHKKAQLEVIHTTLNH